MSESTDTGTRGLPVMAMLFFAICFAVLFFSLGGLAGSYSTTVTMNERWQTDAINRGFAEYAPKTGKFTWKTSEPTEGR